MTDEDKTGQGCYTMVVEFQLDAGRISGDEPVGKVYLRGRYDLSEDGQMEFIYTLTSFFEQVALIIVDMANKISDGGLKKKSDWKETPSLPGLNTNPDYQPRGD